MLAWAVAALVLAMTASSADDGGGDACPAVVSYAEPVLTITEVLDPDGDAVDEVTLVDVRFDGRSEKRDLRFSLEQGGPPWRPGTSTSDSNLSGGVSIGPGRALMCTLPCAFGSNPGKFEVTVESSDGTSATVRGDAHYSGGGSGCGASLDGGTDIVVRLDPVSQG